MGLSRAELLKKLSVVKDGPIDLEKITKKAMVAYEDRHWREDLDNSPHGHPWFTSFHASAFPGEKNLCCNTRGQLYRMMDIPAIDPIPPRLRGQAEMGKAAEEFIINGWREDGILIEAQAKFEDEDTWLTGSSDALLDLTHDYVFYDYVLPVDIKSKDHEVIKDMKLGKRSYEEKDYLQLQAYIYLQRKFHEGSLKPAVGGVLYYVSRQDPTFVREFYIEMNEELINKSVEILKSLKKNFLNGVLPPIPEGHRWSEGLAKWCKYKKECCKKDHKDNVTELVESHSIEFAKFIRPSYDYEKTRREVLKRWN